MSPLLFLFILYILLSSFYTSIGYYVHYLDIICLEIHFRLNNNLIVQFLIFLFYIFKSFFIRTSTVTK